MTEQQDNGVLQQIYLCFTRESPVQCIKVAQQSGEGTIALQLTGCVLHPGVPACCYITTTQLEVLNKEEQLNLDKSTI